MPNQTADPIAEHASDRNHTSGQTFERRIPAGDDFLSPAELKALTPEELTRRTEALAPHLRDNAAQAERQRRPVEAVWLALRRSGFFYQFVPRIFGGMATDTDAFIDAALPLAAADPATAWAACFCAGHNRILAQFPRETQHEIWGGKHPYIIAPLLNAPPGRAVEAEGGYTINGVWTWGSGIMDADWVMAGVMINSNQEGSPPAYGIAIFPAEQASVLDTWYADGLAGSGSNNVEARDLFVPRQHVLADMRLFSGKTPGAQEYPEPIFHMPHITFMGIISAVPIVGAAQGMLEIYRGLLLEKTVKGTRIRLADNAAAQVRVAQADLQISTAEQLLRQVGRQGSLAGLIDEAEQVPLRVRLRAQTAFAVQLCRVAATSMMEGAGSEVHWQSHPFQRLFRDLNLMSSHVAFNADTVNELHGRTLLGLPPNSIVF